MATKKAVIALNGELNGSKEEYKKIIGEKDILFVAADGGALLLESEVNSGSTFTVVLPYKHIVEEEQVQPLDQ